MAKAKEFPTGHWYSYWVTDVENHHQTSSAAPKARTRIAETKRRDEEKRGYPRSDDWHQRQSASTSNEDEAIKRGRNATQNRGYPKSGDIYQKKAAKNAGENRGYPHSGDEYQKKSASGKSSRFALMTAFKEEARKQLKKGK